MSYHIEDEPRPGRLARWSVNPVWPLFAVMFGGAAWSWAWFTVNGAALGSPTRRREIVWVLAGLAGSLVLLAGISALAEAGLIEKLGTRYALAGLTVWKLAVSYRLYLLQSRTFDIFEHFGGQVKNGLPVVVVAYFLTSKLSAGMPTFWALILR